MGRGQRGRDGLCPGAGPDPGVIPYEKVPASIRDNPFLREGYRPPNCSYCRCLASSIEPNNQRWNIWTSTGAIFFFGLWAVDLFITNFFHKGLIYKGLTLETMTDETRHDALFFLAWFFSLMLVNLASAMAHTFSVQNVANFWRWFQFDVGSFASIAISQIYGIGNYANLLSDDMTRWWIRVASITPFVFSGFLIYWNTYCPGINKLYKFGLGLGCVFVGAFPIWHRCAGLSPFSISWALSLGHLTIGGVVFSTFFPERIAAPGTLDLDLYAHPLWHLLANTSFVYNTFAYFEDYGRLKGLDKSDYSFTWRELWLPVGTMLIIMLRSTIKAYLSHETPKIHTKTIKVK